MDDNPYQRREWNAAFRNWYPGRRLPDRFTNTVEMIAGGAMLLTPDDPGNNPEMFPAISTDYGHTWTSRSFGVTWTVLTPVAPFWRRWWWRATRRVETGVDGPVGWSRTWAAWTYHYPAEDR